VIVFYTTSVDVADLRGAFDQYRVWSACRDDLSADAKEHRRLPITH